MFHSRTPINLDDKFELEAKDRLLARAAKLRGTKDDLTSYMARVKIAAAREGLKAYGPTTKIIKNAHHLGYNVDGCVNLLKQHADSLVTS